MAYESGNDRVYSVTDPVTGTLSYTYTSLGGRSTMTLPGGGTWTYTYAPGGAGGYATPQGDVGSVAELLTKITDDQGRIVETGFDSAGGLRTLRSNEVYNTGGTLVASLQTTTQDSGVPDDDPAKVSTPPGQAIASLTYGRNWLSRIQTTWYGKNASQQNIQRIVSESDYGYDDAGQRLNNTSSVQLTNADGSGQMSGSNPIMSSRTESYTYDALNRLKTVNYGDGQTQSYGFDAMGNRLQKTDSAAGTTNSTYDAANRLTGTTGTGASTYTFDADGNTLTGGGRTNTWDSQNRLVSCVYGGTTSTFKYGADGLRRQATVGGVTTDYVYDGSTLIREGHASGGTLTPATITATYLTGPRGPEYRRDDTATEMDSQGRTVSKTRWYVYDGLGSVVGEVDPNGTLTSSPKYDVYGLVRSNSGTASSKMGFVGGLGHLSEANTGLIYMRARYYDPTQGRFSSEDPSKKGMDWYNYCNDNPINSVDKTGRDATAITDFLNTLSADWSKNGAGGDAIYLAFTAFCSALILGGSEKFARGLAEFKLGQIATELGQDDAVAGDEVSAVFNMTNGLNMTGAGRSQMIAGLGQIILGASLEFGASYAFYLGDT